MENPNELTHNVKHFYSTSMTLSKLSKPTYYRLYSISFMFTWAGHF